MGGITTSVETGNIKNFGRGASQGAISGAMGSAM